MYQPLKNLTASQQVGALFFIVFGLLLLASITAVVLSLREGDDSAASDQHRADLHNFEGVLRTSWFMALVFWVGWLSGNMVALVLFGGVSFFALREFMTLSPTRRGDHRSLVLAFFVVLPLQYWLAGFLERNAKLQWGIMVCIFGMSHVPALLLLNFPGYTQRSAFLVFFLVLVVQTCMLAQHLTSRRLRRPPATPLISQSFNWPSWWVGIAVGSGVGGLLAGITPFMPGQAMAMAFIACVAGSLGHLVMKALKRDRGIPIWRGQGPAITGAGGLLDRVDALCFAAPVFFHSIRWYFGL